MRRVGEDGGRVEMRINNTNTGGEEKYRENSGKMTRSTAGVTGENAINSETEVLIFENKFARESKVSLDTASLNSIRWLTTGEAAQYLRVSISSIKTMIYRGQVRVHKLGRRNRFLRDELERLITLPATKSEV